MQLFTRPAPPNGMQGFDDDVETQRLVVKGHFGQGPAPAGVAPAIAVRPPRRRTASTNGKTAKPSKTKESAEAVKDPFVAKWKDYKTTFAEAQSGKCGYCEMMVIGGQPGDVEHYYPKGEVWKLKADPDSWGKEKKWASTIEGRERDVISQTGYWWRAYDWSNYLLACAVCNQYWKLSYFPVQDDPRRLPPDDQVEEIPLLLNPFDSKLNPADHLRFDELGQIEAKDKSSFGYETIRTCGLDRESLRRSRSEKAQRAHSLAQDLNKTQDAATIDRILKDFHSMGQDQHVHSGMVRAIFTELCGLTWAEL